MKNDDEMAVIGLDVETGGLYPTTDALLSVGAWATWDGTGREFLVHVDPDTQPGKEIAAKAAEVNGYTRERWQQAGQQPLLTAMAWLSEWIAAKKEQRPAAVLVCHNLAFDRAFMAESERVSGYTLPGRYDWRCSMVEMARQMDVGLLPKGSASLQRLGELSGFWQEHGWRGETHEALEDARCAAWGWQWLAENARAGGEPELKEVA